MKSTKNTVFDKSHTYRKITETPKNTGMLIRFSKVPNEPTCSDSDASESEENSTDNEELSDELEG